MLASECRLELYDSYNKAVDGPGRCSLRELQRRIAVAIWEAAEEEGYVNEP